MTEHAAELLQVTAWIIGGLLIVIKLLLLAGFSHLTSKLNEIQKCIRRNSNRIHHLELRITKIETKLGISNHLKTATEEED